MSGEERDQIQALSNRVVPLATFVWTVGLTFASAIFAGGSAWGNVNGRIKELETKVDKFEAAQTRMDTNVLIIGERLGIGDRLKRPE